VRGKCLRAAESVSSSAAEQQQEQQQPVAAPAAEEEATAAQAGSCEGEACPSDADAVLREQQEGAEEEAREEPQEEEAGGAEAADEETNSGTMDLLAYLQPTAEAGPAAESDAGGESESESELGGADAAPEETEALGAEQGGRGIRSEAGRAPGDDARRVLRSEEIFTPEGSPSPAHGVRPSSPLPSY